MIESRGEHCQAKCKRFNEFAGKTQVLLLERSSRLTIQRPAFTIPFLLIKSIPEQTDVTILRDTSA